MMELKQKNKLTNVSECSFVGGKDVRSCLYK